MKNRIFAGIGYDIHRFASKRKLYLGGVLIPHTRGLLGHSDADAALHAVSDALLGAAGLGDIGMHFPDTSVKYKNISSLKILEASCDMCARKGFRVNNIDITVIAEEPKISKYRQQMARSIAGIAGTKNVNIKATTNEGLGAIGAKKGIACFAVATLTKK